MAKYALTIFGERNVQMAVREILSEGYIKAIKLTTPAGVTYYIKKDLTKKQVNDITRIVFAEETSWTFRNLDKHPVNRR